MKYGEQAELERQGAKAAARGDALRSNPLLLARNMPTATGESQHEWSSRYDAWQAGYADQRSAVRLGLAEDR